MKNMPVRRTEQAARGGKYGQVAQDPGAMKQSVYVQP